MSRSPYPGPGPGAVMMELMLALVLAPSVLWVLRLSDSVRVIGAVEGVHDGGAGAVSGALRVLFGLSTHNADCAILHSRSFPRISLSVRANRCDVPCCAAHILWAQVAQAMRLAGAMALRALANLDGCLGGARECCNGASIADCSYQRYL